MPDEWLTYREAADRLNVSAQAVRQKAIRGRWQKIAGNDGKARVRLPDNVSAIVSEQTGKHAVRTVSRQASDANAIKALEAHVETLKQQLAASEARAAADLAAERQRADKAIAAFASLAERLDALAVERARPWWRRLRITG